MSEFLQREKQAGQRASSLLGRELRSEISSVFKKETGQMEKSNVTPRYRDGRLDRLVLTSPHYSFKLHYGSVKSGKTKTKVRSGGPVRAHVRQYEGMVRTVRAHVRKRSIIPQHNKNIDYKGYNHIAQAIKKSNVMEVLATDLAENRAVDIVSKIYL